MERRSLVNIFAVVVGFTTATACILGGFYVLLDYALGPVVQYTATLSWAHTVGTIEQVTPTEHGYFCNVRYNYTVANHTYVGNRTRTQHTHPYRSRLHNCRLFRSDNRTYVWYDPKRPSRAALMVTFTGDLWLAVNVLDSLALVALGGGALSWIFRRETPLATLCFAHTATAVVAAVPISVVRLMRGHALAVVSLVAGLVCGAVAVYCGLILSGGRRAKRTLGEKDIDDWWSAPAHESVQQQQNDFGVPETATANT